ncbi:MAG: hypothetical protein ACPG6B_06220 [Oceanihabitans sp.]
MQKLFPLFIFLILFNACDDGDVLNVEIDFDEDTFLACGDLVLYKIKEDPAESLSLQITTPATSLENLIATDADGNLLTTQADFTITASSNTFHYRSYNNTPTDFFCNDVPPSNIQISNDDQSDSGIARFTMELIEDDNDGIPAILEDINGNGDLTDDDTDGDGLPNYIDEDDDGDNVLTRLEIDNEDLDEDQNPLTNPLDTDGDNIPNYLDTDDDNDGVATINEENDTQDQNPTNDFTDPAIADFLNPIVSTTIAATAYRVHDIQQKFEVKLVITGLSLSNIIIVDPYNFGSLEDSRLNQERSVIIPF